MPCSITSLCGISNDFSLLFPSNRQVAYVLLTSPPLTASNLKESIKSVRLACLMCAASVNPEPGSNSLINCIYIMLIFKHFTYHYLVHILYSASCFVFFLVFSKFSWLSTNCWLNNSETFSKDFIVYFSMYFVLFF